jgi:hypothetical protein
MIGFEQVWLPQIVTYARLISTGQLEDQWLGRSDLTSSVTDPHELHEQIFDDLDAVAIWSAARQNEGISASAVSAIDSFLAALSGVEGNDAATVVGSSAWAIVLVAASAVLANVS